MKFVISLIAMTFVSANAFASPIQIFYEQEATRAKIVKEIFMNTYSIPEDLIDLKLVKRCADLKKKGKLDLCLNNKGDLLVVSLDRGFISESLKIFQAP